MSALTRLQAYLTNMRLLPVWTYPQFAQQLPTDLLGVFAGTTTGTSTVVTHPLWNAATSYSAGEKVQSGFFIYASLLNFNINHAPPNASWWALSTSDRYPTGTGSSNGEFYLATDVSPPQVFTWYSGTWYQLAAGSGGTGSGSVLTVTATAPVVSSGGASPDISMAAATSVANGYMTSTYASKLDGIEAGANLYVLPIAAAGSLGGIRVGSGLSIDGSGILSATTVPDVAATTAALGNVRLTVADQVPANPVVPNRTVNGSMAVVGNYADGASAIGVVIDNSISLTSAGASLLSVQNATVEKLAVDIDGLLTWPDGQTFGLDPAGNTGRLQAITSRAAIDASGDFVIDTVNDRTAGTGLLSVRNQGAGGLLDVRGDGFITTHHGFKSSDGANPYSFIANNQDTGGPVTAVILDNLNALTNVGSKLVSIQNNAVEKAYLDIGGRLYHGITWDDMQGPVNAAALGPSAPTNEQYRDTLARMTFFRHDQDDSLTFSYQTPHRWIRDTEVRVHIHYIPMVTPATNQVVRIQYSYAWAHPDTAVPANTGWTTSFTDITIPSSGADTFNEKLASLFNTTPTGSKESSILIVNITRLSSSASDTYTTGKADNTPQANFCVLSVDCHYQSNKEGTVDPIPA